MGLFQLTWCVYGFLLVLFISCASQAKKPSVGSGPAAPAETESPGSYYGSPSPTVNPYGPWNSTPSSSISPVISGGNTNTPLALDCPPLTTASFPPKITAGFQNFKMFPLKTLQNSRVMSFCQVLKQTGKSVGIFQLAGVTCLSCQEEAKYLSGRFSTPSATIAHILVFTDFINEYEEGDFKKFMDQYAPGSVRAHDDGGVIWKALSANPASPSRGTILTMNLAQDGYLLQTEEPPQKIVDLAQSLQAKK